MRIIVCPDSFKGSLSAVQVTNIIKIAFQDVDSGFDVVGVPIADGGEGTLDAFYASMGGILQTVNVHNPLMEQIEANYLVLPDQTCVIEMAQSSGLQLIKEHLRNPLIATSYGMGEVIRHALDAGYRKFIVGIGGSATNDGGYGLLRALGMRFLDEQGLELPENTAALKNLVSIDTSQFDNRVGESSWTIACDVDNPLLGENGATTVFGPQKGVIPDMQERLEQALTKLAHVTAKQAGYAVHEVAGAGAAGGVGMALLAYFQATLKQGIVVLSHATELEQKITQTDYVITGEGYSDSQTLNGKAPLGVAKLAKQQQIPVALLSGKVESKSLTSLKAIFDIVMAVVAEEVPTAFAIEHAKELLFKRAKELAQQLKEIE